MTALAIVTGSLFRAPEQRTSKAGKPFVTATIRAKDGEASQWWRVTVFSESAQAELMRLGDGDALSVQGAMKVELFTPDGGATKLSLSIVADHVLALRQPPKERKAKTSGDAARGGAAAFDDSIPFGAP
jgi:single-stranded DNA-binding protein